MQTHGHQVEEESDDVLEDLLHGFNNLSRRTVTLRHNLDTLLCKQQRIGSEMKHMTNSLNQARYRTQHLTTIFQTSSADIGVRGGGAGGAVAPPLFGQHLIFGQVFPWEKIFFRALSSRKVILWSSIISITYDHIMRH